MTRIMLPQTRYYGSKRKIIEKIWNIMVEEAKLDFESVLDIFGGSGTFAYFAKLKGKQSYYNDIFQFNYFIGKKLIEQNTNELTYDEAVSLFEEKPDKEYLNYISTFYKDIYYTNEENKQLDIYIQNVLDLTNENKKCSALYIIFQSCMMKRPYNLFHRKNLNMRVNYAGGKFGNKKTWERSFKELFTRFITELDSVCIDNGRLNNSNNFNALGCPVVADLIYIDPPYFTIKNSSSYHSKYHFLEGLVNYYEIPQNINFQKLNREIDINASREFESKTNFLNDLTKLIEIHIDSHLVISYRNNGIPSILEIGDLLRQYDNYDVSEYNLGKYNYALNKNNTLNEEVLFVCKNRSARL